MFNALPAVALVDAIDEAAVGFYERHGFVRFPHQPLRLLLAVTAIPQGVEGVDQPG